MIFLACEQKKIFHCPLTVNQLFFTANTLVSQKFKMLQNQTELNHLDILPGDLTFNLSKKFSKFREKLQSNCRVQRGLPLVPILI